MPSVYPANFDNFTNPASGDSTNSATVPHAAQHANLNDAIEAVQAELGLDPSGAAATVKARLDGIDATIIAIGATVLSGLPSSSVTLAKMAQGSVDTPQLVDNSVSTAKLQLQSVTGSRLADASITGAKIVDGTIGATKLTGVSLNSVGSLASRPGSGAVGQVYFDTTGIRQWLWDGTGWIIESEPTTTTFVPTIAAVSGTITTVGTVTFTYHRCDGWLDYTLSATITTNGTGITGVTFTLPIASASAANDVIGSGRESALAGKSLTAVLQSSSVGMIFNYDNTYPASNGAILKIAGRYRMTTRYS